MAEDEIVMKPMTMDDKSAATMWGALRKMVPNKFWAYFFVTGVSTGELPKIALCLGADHAFADLMTIAYFENITGKHVLVFPGLCKQHATGLCLKPVAVQLAMVSPCYCLASKMRCSHFHQLLPEGVRKSLKEELRWI